MMAVLACSNKEIDLLPDNIDDNNDNGKPSVAVFQVSLNTYKTTLFKGESTSLVSSIFPEVATFFTM